MTDFKTAIREISGNNREPDWFRDLRFAALDRFEASPLPGKTEDEWRKVDFNKIFFSDIGVDAAAAPDYPKQGSFYLGTLSQAAREVPDLARPRLESPGRRNGRKYDALASALCNGGVFLHVPDGVNVEKPLSVLMKPVSELQGGPRPSYFPNRIILLGKNSSLTLLSSESNRADWDGWLGSLTEVHLGEGSNLSFARVQDSGKRSVTLSSFTCALERGASLNFLVVNKGSSINKSNWNAVLAGEGSTARMFGLAVGEDNQDSDQTVYVGHEVPNTRSDVLFKSALKDRSRSLFSGLIHVKKPAQKTDAYQTNRNLLLSREARADTIPKLEIEADDVKCGHGAAVSSIDEDQLFYLMSRGLSRPDAQAVIIESFCEDVLARWLEGAAPRDPAGPARTELENWTSRVLSGGGGRAAAAAAARS